MQAESTSHENGGMGLRNAGDGGPDEYRRNAQNGGPSSRGIANSGLHNGPGAWASISGDIHHQVDSHGPPSGASRGQQFQRISRPVELMRPSYDVVVIGSGYGGGVAASRMSRAKQTVCVLERGKERWPGEYPDKFLDAARELRISGEFAPGDRRSVSGTLVEGGNPTGLYHVAVGDGQNVYCANGLGGTSLVNANVFLEAHPAILDMHVWPKELRGRDAWKKYYERAASVLEPVPYPSTFPELRKASLLQKQADLLACGDKVYRVPQTTRFEDGPNSTGVFMRASTLSGMDATGINDGSKTTTLVTYLSDAWNWGAEIFCECEVRYVEEAPRDRGGYIVYFAWHGGNRGRFTHFYDDLMWVHAKKLVFFGAGSLGTTEILLRSRQRGLRLSDNLGTQMSGNGDMLGFGYNSDYEANCIAGEDVTSPESPVGPCITTVLDLRDKKNPLEGFVVEDCAVPEALSPFMYGLMEYLPDELVPSYGLVKAVLKRAARLGSKHFGPYFPRGSIRRTPVYLIMSHDSSQGRLTLRGDTPVLSYSGVGRSKSASRIHDFLEHMTAAIGGNFIANPAWSLLGQQQITVHPIGGAGMSPDGRAVNGVTNHMGQLFNGDGDEVYEGLVVCDASLLPAAVGVNPFATITALAERSVELISKKHGLKIDYDTKNGLLHLFGDPMISHEQDEGMEGLSNVIRRAASTQTPGVEFSEVMSGYIHAGPDLLDFEIAERIGRSRCEAARFFLTVKSWDIAELVNNTRHTANLTGTFSCEALGGVFMVHRGTFQLFNQDPRTTDTTNLTYDFDMQSTSGKELHFYGYKVVNSAGFLNPLELVRQTTTLYVTITDKTSGIVGRGKLHIQPRDFYEEAQTFRTTGASILQRLGSAARFVAYFAENLAVPFLSPLGPLQWPKSGATTDGVLLVARPSQTIHLTASDGVQTSMVMWEPLGKGATTPAPIMLLIPGASVDHTMFALPTIDKNAVTFFREAGYRVYCITHRVGRTMEARRGHTPYDTRHDIRAALARIRETNGAPNDDDNLKIYVVAHCAGSIALACGLLDGTIPARWIRGLTASMVFMNPKFGKVNSVLAGMPVNWYAKLVSPYWDCTNTPDDTLLQRIVNQLLRFYPVGPARETCRSVVCHRSELVFGRLWTHENLNEATHANLERFLGGVSMRCLDWLMKTGDVGEVTTNEPTRLSLVKPENIDRLKGLPILFLSGTGNMVYTEENTDKSYTTLCHAHGSEWYEREVFLSKGHLDAWMGPTAYQDVYPRVLQHVEKTMQTHAKVRSKNVD